MFKKSIIIIIFTLFISTSIFSQTKVGTFVGSNLSFVPSVASLGMGEVGVSLVNEKSMYFNPGSLGLYFTENTLSISGYPGANEIYLLDFYNASLLIPIKRYDSDESPFVYGLGFYYSKTSFTLEETTYEYPEGNGVFHDISLKNCNFVLSAAYCGKIEIGTGLNVKYIDENLMDIGASTLAFDWGLVVRIPMISKLNNNDLSFIITPALGLSLSNFGESYKYDNTTLGSNPDIPTTIRRGISTEFALQKKYNSGLKRRLLNLIVSYEIEKSEGLSKDPGKTGVELWLAEIVSLRIGQISYTINTNTSGFSLSTKGLFRLFKSNVSDQSFLKFMRDKLEIKYSYAKNSFEDDFYPEINYHEIIINYTL